MAVRIIPTRTLPRSSVAPVTPPPVAPPTTRPTTDRRSLVRTIGPPLLVFLAMRVAFALVSGTGIAYVDAMTRDVAVPDDVFTDMSRHFDDRKTVEVTVLVGAYNMQTRVLRALGIESWKP